RATLLVPTTMSHYPPFFARDLGDAEKGGDEPWRSKDPITYRDGKSNKREDIVEEDYRRQLLISPYAKYVAPDALIWALYLEEAEADDRELMDPWSKNLDSLLVFVSQSVFGHGHRSHRAQAGLFAAILTAFLVESRKELFEDSQTQLLKEILITMRNSSDTSNPEAFTPEASFLNINGLWFTSLTLTLASALGGVLSKGWIATHSSSSMRKTSNDAFARHLRSNRIRKWRVGAIISIVSLLIQIALFLFFVGLVLILWSTDDRIKFTILALVSITSLLYLVITFLPWIFPACPLQTPITEGTPWIRRPDVYGQRGRSMNTPAGADRGLWVEVTSLYEELRSIPKPQELEAQILAWVISNTLDKRVLTEALKALAGVEWTQELRRTLAEFGAFSVLRTRLPQYLNQARVSGDSDEEWTCILLYLMLQIEMGVQGDKAGERSPFESLLREGGALHRWQDFRPDEQPLACSLRLHILMNCDMDEPDTTWQGQILGLVKAANEQPNSSMRNILFHAATRGVSSTKENLRRMCGKDDIETLSNQLERSNRGTLGDSWKGNYQSIPQVLCRLCLDEDSGIREGAIEALVRMSADDQLCAEFERAFEELVSMRNKDQIPATLAVTAALVQNGRMCTCEKKKVHEARDGGHYTRGSKCSSRVLGGIRKCEHDVGAPWYVEGFASTQSDEYKVEMQSEIIEMIPGLIRLMTHNDSTRYRVERNLMDSIDAFEPQIRALIQDITTLLGHDSNEVMRGVVRIVEAFSADEFKAAVQKIIDLHSHNSEFARGIAMNTIKDLSALAALELEIRAAIPQVIELLSDSSDSVRGAAVSALITLTAQ
ncbi:7372_t:CDS:2, partial [Acaulospora colombiana]